MKPVLPGVLRLLHEAGQRSRMQFSPLGRLLIQGALAAALLAPGPSIHTLELMTLCLALISVGLAGTRLQATQLEAIRCLPRHCTVDLLMHYRIRISNRSTQTLRSITIIDELQHNYPQHFHGYRRWHQQLLHIRGGSIPAAAHALRLAPGESIELDMELLPHRRGWLHFKCIHLLLPEALGLCNRRISLPLQDKLISLPPRYPMQTINTSGGAGQQQPTPQAGPALDFLYLREYRPGDPVRKIHWPAYARHHSLLVREQESPNTPRIGLLLDTCAATARNFEAAVSVAASLLHPGEVQNSGCKPSLLVIGNQSYLHIPQLPNYAGEWNMLEHLACATTETATRLPAFISTAQRRSTQHGIDTLVAIFPQWDPARQALCTALRHAGHRVLALVTGTGATPAPSPTPGDPVYLDMDQPERELNRPLCAR